MFGRFRLRIPFSEAIKRDLVKRKPLVERLIKTCPTVQKSLTNFSSRTDLKGDVNRFCNWNWKDFRWLFQSKVSVKFKIRRITDRSKVFLFQLRRHLNNIAQIQDFASIHFLLPRENPLSTRQWFWVVEPILS
jgi:hypothetical protein